MEKLAENSVSKCVISKCSQNRINEFPHGFECQLMTQIGISRVNSDSSHQSRVYIGYIKHIDFVSNFDLKRTSLQISTYFITHGNQKGIPKNELHSMFKLSIHPKFNWKQSISFKTFPHNTHILVWRQGYYDRTKKLNQIECILILKPVRLGSNCIL